MPMVVSKAGAYGEQGRRSTDGKCNQNKPQARSGSPRFLRHRVVWGQGSIPHEKFACAARVRPAIGRRASGRRAAGVPNAPMPTTSPTRGCLCARRRGRAGRDAGRDAPRPAAGGPPARWSSARRRRAERRGDRGGPVSPRRGGARRAVDRAVQLRHVLGSLLSKACWLAQHGRTCTRPHRCAGCCREPAGASRTWRCRSSASRPASSARRRTGSARGRWSTRCSRPAPCPACCPGRDRRRALPGRRPGGLHPGRPGAGPRRAESTSCTSAGSSDRRAAASPWDPGLVAFEIARRHRFVEEMSILPAEVRAHVLPSGEDNAPLSRCGTAARPMWPPGRARHQATAAYLGGLPPRTRPAASPRPARTAKPRPARTGDAGAGGAARDAGAPPPTRAGSR